MFRSSIMKSVWWKCGIYASSQLWGLHMFDDDSNILGTSCSTWWTKDLRQIAAKFVPICWKMTRNKTNFLCARASKNRPKRKETSIQFRAGDESWVYGYDPGTKQQSSQWKNHPSAIQESWGRLSQASRACCVFLNREAVLQKEFFSSVPACESTVLPRSTEGFCGSCWEKMPHKWHTQDWLLHHDNTSWHTDSWLFPVPTQKNGGGICPLYFSILVFLAYSGSQR